MKKITILSKFKIPWFKSQNLLFLLFILVFWISNGVYAQPMFQSTAIPSSSNSFPLSSSTSNKVQWLYLPSEITPAAPSALISKIYLRVGGSSSGSTFTNLKVSLGTTTQTATTSTFVTGLQLCYSNASATFPSYSQGDWLEIVLQTPFLWNGTSNLIVEVSQEGYSGGVSMWQATNGNKRTWNSLGDLTSLTGTAGTGQVHIGFDMMSATPCSGTPTAGTASVTSRVCLAQPFTLTLTNPTFAAGITYQWQSSPLGAGTFTDIPGATTTSYVVSTQPISSEYRCVVKCTNSNTSVNSNVVTVAPIAAIGNFFEGFENAGVGSSTNRTVPPCWTYLFTGSSTSVYGYTYTTAPKTGSKHFYTYRTSQSGTTHSGESLLISPLIDNLGNGTKQLRFSARTYLTGSYSGSLKVYSMNGNTATASKTLIATVNIPVTATYYEYIVPIPATTDDYFAFSFEEGKMTNYTFIDDIYYEDLSPCIFPMNGQVSNISITGATVSWNAPQSTGVTGYEYEVRTSGNPGTAGAVQTGTITTTPPSVNLTNLTGATTYYVYIRSVCGTSKGIWTMFPVEFNTLCPIFSANFFEGFESTATGGSTNETYPICWTYIDTVNPVNNAYNYVSTIAKTGSRGYYSYRYPLQQSDGQLMLISPETNNLGNGTKQIRFWARSSSTSYSPKLVIYSMNGNTTSATRTLITSINIPPTTTFAEYIVPLPATTDDYFAFSFEHQVPTQYTAIYLDDIYYEDMAACIFPLNIKTSNTTTTGTTISWDASLGSGVTGYEYEIRTSGAAGSGATGLAQTGTVAAPATSVNITGLNHSTVYTIYVRSKCGTANGSWSMIPVTFNTLCGAFTGNFFEGFETTANGASNNQNAPICWTNINSTGSTSVYGYVNNGTPKTGSKSFYAYRTSLTSAPNGDFMLVSPETVNLGNGTKRLRFWARTSSTSYIPKLSIYTMNSNSGLATKTLVKSIPITSTTYTEYIVYFPITTDDYFAFSFEHTVGSEFPAVYLDDIYYEDAPSCKPIETNTIKVTDIGKTNFKVSWQDLYNLNPVAYEVEVRATGNPGTPGAAFIGTTAVGVTSIVATGLNPSTEYKVYVRSKCSATDFSDWSGSVVVKTLCNYSDFVSYTPSLALCGPQKAELDAVLVDPSFDVAWFDTKDDLNPLHIGSNFVSATDVTQDRSFWLRSQKILPNTSVAIGTGTLTSEVSGTFLYHSWGGYKHQYIFTAKELSDAGLAAGPITALKFDVVKAGDARQSFSMALGATTQNSATTTHIANANLTQVYNNASQTFTVGVNTITFTTPYNWDGVSNIVVQTNWSNVNSGNFSGNGALRYHKTTSSMTTYTYADNRSAAEILSTNTGSVNGSGGTGTTVDRPNTIFVGNSGCVSPAIEIPVTVSLKPAFDISATSITSCGGGASDPVTITTNLGNYDTFVWTPSTGVTGDAVTGWTFATTQEQDYVLTATQSTGICKVEKTVRVFAGQNPVPNAALASTYDLCKNQTQELKALEPIPANASVGTGTGTTAATSVVSAYVQSAVYSKQQYIYSASELIAQGVTTAGYINSLALETINSGASLSNPSYTVKMMLTPNTTFGTSNFETTGLSTVFSRVNHTHTFQGVQTMVLDSPFFWDGQSNILVEITQEGAGAGNNAETYFTTVTGSNVGIYASHATDPVITTGTRTTDRLNVKFGFIQSEVTWSPASNLYLDAATTVPYISGTNALKVYVVSSGTLNQVYNATLSSPVGCETIKAVTVNVVDVTTPVVQNQTFCQTTPVSSIVVTGGTGATYEFFSSATATTPITSISQTGTYYIEATQGNCKSTRVPFTATISVLGLPTAQLTQVVCGGGTVSSLQASGVSNAQINWYASASSTTPLASTQALTNNTTYYASQSVGTCESGRIAVLVNVNPAPAALTPQSISFCGTLSYGSANLNQIPGSELVWYPSATSQTPIPNNGQIVSGTYYVSQKVNGCESLRVQVIVSSAQSTVPAPSATIQNICGSGTVAQLTATLAPNATAEWYNSATATAPLAATTPLTSGTYYLAQKVGNCLSVKVPVAVRVISTSAPAVSPITLCDGATVGDLNIPSPTGVSHKWYLNSTVVTPLPLTDVLKSGIYFVSKVEGGCESGRTQVQVTINSRPNSPTGTSPQTFQDVDFPEISNLIMNQPNVIWYATYDDAMKGINPLAQNMPLVHQATYYAVIIGANGCPSLPTPIDVIILLGVNDFDLSKLNYYPNPVNDQLTISYSETITNVAVFDLNGRLVIQKDFNSDTVQLSFHNLSAGTYMVNVKTKENSQFIKIVKK